MSTIAGINSITSVVVARPHLDHHPVRPQPQHRRRRARRADRADGRAAPAADRNDDAAELPQGQSGRFPGRLHQPEFRRPCRCRRSTNTPRSCWRSRFRSFPGVAQVDGLRRAEIRRARPGRSGRGGRAQHLARRHPPRRRQDQFQLAGRHALRPAPERHAAGDRRHAQARTNTSKVVVAYRNGAPVKLRRDRARHRQRRERQDRELVQRQPLDRAGDPAPAGRQHGRGRRCGRRSACRPTARRCRPSINMEVLNRSFDLDPRVGRGRAGSRWRSRSRWWSW